MEREQGEHGQILQEEGKVYMETVANRKAERLEAVKIIFSLFQFSQ